MDSYLELIAAVDENWAIGYKNELLFRIPADLKLNFKEKTLGQVVVMGRKTLESLPGQKPLPDRVNIVVSSSMAPADREDLIVCPSLDELFKILPKFPGQRIFIAGGASLYAQLLPYCAVAHITKVMAQKKADCYLANLDQERGWMLAEKSLDQIHDKTLKYFFCAYENLGLKAWGEK